jgi:hypothetical protein
MFARQLAIQESNVPIASCKENYEESMATTDNNIDALLELDRFVRMMAAAPRCTEIVLVVRAYLASWAKDRIVSLQSAHAGWVPFDEYQRPFRIVSVSDVHQIRNSIRIRCRELEASGLRIGPELLELDLFLFFANESLEVHAPRQREVVDSDSVIEEWRPHIAAVYGAGAAATPELMAWRSAT